MMKIVVTVVLLIAFGIGSAHAGNVPPEATYLFFIQGKYVGKCAIEVTQEDGVQIYTSISEVQLDDFFHKLSCRTEIVEETLRPVFLQFEGVRNDAPVALTASFEGDSVTIDNLVLNENVNSKLEFTDPSYLFQDYVSEHQIIILKAIVANKELIARFNVLLPSSVMTLPAMATLESELELNTPKKPIVCKKYVVAIQNSATYYLYYDPKRGIPIYMDFSATQTEVFLESVFGREPETKYSAPETKE